MALKTTYLTRDHQDVYDLSIQLYGDISKIGILLKLFPNLNNGITLNSPIALETQTDPIAKYFKDQGIIVATDTDTQVAVNFRITNLGRRIINTGDFRVVA